MHSQVLESGSPMHSMCAGFQRLHPHVAADVAVFERLMELAARGVVFGSLYENKAGFDKAVHAPTQAINYAIHAFRQCV